MPTINLRDIPADLHRKAHILAAQEGVTLKALILNLIEEATNKASLNDATDGDRERK